MRNIVSYIPSLPRSAEVEESFNHIYCGKKVLPGTPIAACVVSERAVGNGNRTRRRFSFPISSRVWRNVVAIGRQPLGCDMLGPRCDLAPAKVAAAWFLHPVFLSQLFLLLPRRH